MSTPMTHPRVSDDVSADRVNRVNREQHDDWSAPESAGRNRRSGGQVWRNIGSLRTLLARAERELAREPGAYIAVAVVHADKREEQVGRWVWAGGRQAGGQVAAMGGQVGVGDRGLRVRVHREGGRLVGSTLLRRTAGGTAAGGAPVEDGAGSRGADRIAMLEARVAGLLERLAMQDWEISALKGTIEEMGPVSVRLGNLHSRLDALEAVAHRHVEDEFFADDAVDDAEGADDESGADDA